MTQRRSMIITIDGRRYYYTDIEQLELYSDSRILQLAHTGAYGSTIHWLGQNSCDFTGLVSKQAWEFLTNRLKPNKQGKKVTYRGYPEPLIQAIVFLQCTPTGPLLDAFQDATEGALLRSYWLLTNKYKDPCFVQTRRYLQNHFPFSVNYMTWRATIRRDRSHKSKARIERQDKFTPQNKLITAILRSGDKLGHEAVSEVEQKRCSFCARPPSQLVAAQRDSCEKFTGRIFE